MLTRTLVVAATAIWTLVGALSATAADLDPGYAQEDRRYDDIYRHPPPPPPRYSEPQYAPPPVYREQRYAPPPPPYAHAPPPYRNDGRIAGDCLPRHAIRERLTSRGWQDFQDPQIAGNVAHVRARRPSGQLFDLTVDRCTGEILGAEALDARSAQAPDWRYRNDGYRDDGHRRY